MTDTLLPCPFCGAHMDGQAFGENFHPPSDDCPLDSLFIEDRLRAAWNRRATPTLAAALAVPEVQAMVEALRDVIEGWDWWQKDTYDRCQSVPGDAIDHARAALAAVEAAR